jgi:hypothetical protein
MIITGLIINCLTFLTMLVFYGEELLAPHPIPILEDHTISAVLDYFFQYEPSVSIKDGYFLD